MGRWHLAECLVMDTKSQTGCFDGSWQREISLYIRGMKCWLISLCLVLLAGEMIASEGPSRAFGIHVVDETTGVGVPLVELRMVHGVSWVSDNAGWIYFHEPGLMDRELAWLVSGPGISYPKDGFGYACFRARSTPGQMVKLPVRQTTIATRVGRLTGQGLYRDSELLGKNVPVANGNSVGLLGQDSVQAVVFQEKLFWLWGDTSIARYPLGNFHTTCAWTERDADPEKGLHYQYFTEPEAPQSLRRMLPLKEPGAVWMFGLLAQRDLQGRERLFAGYSRQKGLVPADEKGIAEYFPEKGRFAVMSGREKSEAWRMPMGQAVRVTTSAGDHWYFSAPFTHVRVRADVADLLRADCYEMLRFDSGSLQWIWQREQAPTTAAEEKVLLEKKLMPLRMARYQLRERDTGRVIRVHGASIQWNAWRKRFVMIAVQAGEREDPSPLGEVWYAESDAIDGPWTTGVKIATHPSYSFYNPIHHPFFDREGGRMIYFEGTYTKEFSGQSQATPRYDYNQLLYRLDLQDERLQAKSR